MISTDTTTPKRRVHHPLPIPDLAKLPPTAACTTRQTALVSGFSPVTLKAWRRAGKGPQVTYIEGKPRYLVRDLRAWFSTG